MPSSSDSGLVVLAVRVEITCDAFKKKRLLSNG